MVVSRLGIISHTPSHTHEHLQHTRHYCGQGDILLSLKDKMVDFWEMIGQWKTEGLVIPWKIQDLKCQRGANKGLKTALAMQEKVSYGKKS